MPTTLSGWLAHCESIHTQEIDLSLERTQRVREWLGLDFRVPVFTVAGTNGKGSTCAMLESIALQAGWRVGSYIKPHIVHFEERCRIGGRPIDADALLPHFEAVERARRDMTLSMFEFTTLAIARALSQAELDMVILEVGLGGRFDAVNAFDTDCAIITSIALDHTEFLGTDRESIGFEKAGILRRGKPAIVGDPAVPNSVVAVAEEVGADLRLVGRDFRHSGDRQQWNWHGRQRRYSGLAYPALRGANQLLNASAVLAAFEAMHEVLPISAQAVRSGFALVELPGRFQVVPGRPTLVLDVAHNPHAVAALAENLDSMGFHPRTHAVFGAMRDKDIAGMLERIAPLVDAWHFTDLPIARAARADELAACRASLSAKGPGPESVARHGDPATALRAALEHADPADRILVFGSFYTVGGVLQAGLPRLAGPHTA